jgi:zinc/manganese transport system permease protein
MLFGGFLGNALLAGSAIAVACGLIGWFVVMRRQLFAGDALSHVAFTGALAAAAAGLDLRLGLFVATIAVALLLAALGNPPTRAPTRRPSGRAGRTRRSPGLRLPLSRRLPAWGGSPAAGVDDVTIGVVFVWVLGLGVFFLDLFNAGGGGAEGTIASRTLFGSIFGLSAGEAQLAALLAAGTVLVLAAIARPLLFASVDASLAAAGGVPVGGLGVTFLVLLGVVAAEATQAVGALLLLGLLAAPAGAAHRLTANPYRGMALAAGIALLSMWCGIALSYWIPVLPPGSAVILVAAGCYALTMVL